MKHNNRILLVDDSQSIHDDFKKILGQQHAPESKPASNSRSGFFGGATEASAPAPQETEQASESASLQEFELTSALQGQEAVELVQKSMTEGEPFAMAFVDVRMPPGWDGIRTVAEIWKVDPRLQIVICTAYSDYSWSDTLNKLPHPDRLLILKKPFDSVEILQLAYSLTAKWNLAQREGSLIAGLQRAEQESRAYASSLETVNRALEGSKASAEGSAREMGDFLVRLASELQGGLTSVLQPIIEEASLSLDQGPEVYGSLTTASRLLGSLGDLQDLCLIETGRLSSKPVQCSPIELARSVALELQPLSEALGVRLSTELDENLPEAILVDELRLGQILRQLVRNAVDHSRSERVSLRAHTIQTGDWKRPTLRFEVTDQGVGIPAEQQASIFSPFVRLDDKPSAAGTGIGLALAKRLANLLMADLTVQSAPGGGSTFRLDISTRTPDPSRS